MRGMIGTRGMRVGTWRIWVRMQAIKVGIRGIRVVMQGIRVGMWVYKYLTGIL